MTASALTLDALGSSNLELQNSILSHKLLSAFIGNVEYMQNQLLIKMDDDRQRTDMLKERLSLQQDLARQVEDPEKDDKKHLYFISFDGSTVSPFATWRAVGPSSNVPDAISSLKLNGMGPVEIMKNGGTIWYNEDAAQKLSGKQLYAYYDQQAEATKSAMSALNAVTSQDNLTLQSLRSKVDSNTQLLSTIIKNEKERKETVMRNMG